MFNNDDCDDIIEYCLSRSGGSRQGCCHCVSCGIGGQVCLGMQWRGLGLDICHWPAHLLKLWRIRFRSCSPLFSSPMLSLWMTVAFSARSASWSCPPLRLTRLRFSADPDLDRSQWFQFRWQTLRLGGASGLTVQSSGCLQAEACVCSNYKCCDGCRAQCTCTFAIHDPDTTLAELLLGQETEEYL